jgi:hypothetical protein
MGWDVVRLTCIEIKKNLLPQFTLKLDVPGSSEMVVSKTGRHKSLGAISPSRLTSAECTVENS